MKTVKLSYSIINAWADANYEQAIGYYLGQPLPATPAMELGKLKHEIYANHAIKTKTLHEDLGGGELIEPIVEQKYQKIIPFSADIQILLRGIPDTTDRDIVYEYKVGRTKAGAYVDKLQLDYMKLLIPRLRLGVYLCHNPYTGRLTKGIKYLNDSNAEAALEHIITFGGEIIDYLQANKLLKDYRG